MMDVVVKLVRFYYSSVMMTRTSNLQVPSLEYLLYTSMKEGRSFVYSVEGSNDFFAIFIET